MEKIQDKQDKLLEETGAWILSDTLFTKWLNEKSSRLLWLHGDPGEGKTQLFSSPNAVKSPWRIFQKITGHPSIQSVYVIIDALDECEAESVESLLMLIDPDLELHERGSQTEATQKVKWLLTSRNEATIRQCLIGSLEISLQTNHVRVEEAVQKFIDVKTKQLQHRKGYEDQLKQFVSHYLRQNAEGTFLWVALACRELSKPTVLSMNTKAVLLKLPSGIAPLYGRHGSSFEFRR